MVNNLLEIFKGDGSSHYLGIVAGNSNGYYFSDFGECMIYALIGILIVFVGIAIIVGILYLVGFIMKKTTGLELFKKKDKKVKGAAVQSDSESDEVPDEVKAAIVAALMAYYSQENPKCEFKVKRIKRI